MNTSKNLRGVRKLNRQMNKIKTALHKLGVENLEERQLLSASTFVEASALVDLTSGSALVSQENAIAPIDLSSAVLDYSYAEFKPYSEWGSNEVNRRILVTTTEDYMPPNGHGPEPEIDGSYRQAIWHAKEGDVIAFSSELAGQTITLKWQCPLDANAIVDATNLYSASGEEFAQTIEWGDDVNWESYEAQGRGLRVMIGADASSADSIRIGRPATDATLRGLFIENGHAGTEQYPKAAALNCNGRVTVESCVMVNNAGYGIFSNYNEAIINLTNCVIANAAIDGVYASGSVVMNQSSITSCNGNLIRITGSGAANLVLEQHTYDPHTSEPDQNSLTEEAAIALHEANVATIASLLMAQDQTLTETEARSDAAALADGSDESVATVADLLLADGSLTQEEATARATELTRTVVQMLIAHFRVGTLQPWELSLLERGTDNTTPLTLEEAELLARRTSTGHLAIHDSVLKDAGSCGVLHQGSGKLTFENSEVCQTGTFGISAQNAEADLINSEISECVKGGVRVGGVFNALNCRIHDNGVYGVEGKSSATIIDSLVYNNGAHGVVIVCPTDGVDSHSVVVKNSKLAYNKKEGVDVSNADLMIYDSYIVGNGCVETQSQLKSGVYFQSGLDTTMTINNSVVVQNGMYGVSTRGTAYVTNVTMARNRRGIHTYGDDAELHLRNTLVVESAENDLVYNPGKLFASDSLVGGAEYNSLGELNELYRPGISNPLFVSETGYADVDEVLAGETSPYALAAGSIAIDGGDNQYVAATEDYDWATDLAGNPRICSEDRVYCAKVDMGAYESTYEREIPSIVVTTLADRDDPTDGLISLREAVQRYSVVGAANTITFAEDLKDADGNVVDSKTFTFTEPMTVEKNVVLDATGLSFAAVEGLSYFFNVKDAGEFTLKNVSLSGATNAAITAADEGKIELINVLLAENATGVRISDSAQLQAINTTIARNSSFGLRAQGGAAALLNTIVVMNGTKDAYVAEEASVDANYVVYGTVSGANLDAETNVVYTNGDSLFTDAENGDYSLYVGSDEFSIAIDVGDNSVLSQYYGENPVDLAGKARLNGQTIDVGAYEAQIAYETPSIIVTTTDDIVDPNDGLISLREAVEVYFAYETRTFDATVDSTGQTVTFNLTEPDDVFLEEGEITISDAMTIYGGTSATITIDGCYQSRIFNVADGVESVEFQGLILQRGKADKAAGAYYTSGDAYDEAFEAYDGGAIYATTAAITVKDSEIDDNAGYIGGAIFVNGGTLTIENTTFENNDSAYQGGAIAVYGAGSTDAALVVADSSFTYNESDRAGAIYFKDGVASVSGTTFDRNEAAYASGGAITVSNATLTATNVDMSENMAGRFGGAIFAGTSTVTINNGEDVAISGNTAQYGGAIYASKGAVVVEAGVFSSNTAEYSGGAIFTGGALTVAGAFDGNEAGENGGAICANDDLTATGATFENNEAMGAGGAIYATKGDVSVSDSAFSGNASTLGGGAIRLAKVESATIENATFENNAATGAGGAINASASGELTISGGAFTVNSAENSGGAIYATGTVVSSANADYDGNESEKFGGAIAVVNDSELSVEGGTFENGAASAGGAIYAADSEATITADILNNTATTYGGGIYAVSADISVQKSQLIGNTATSSGGAIFASKGSTEVAFTDLTNNAATNGFGGAIYATSNGETLTLKGGEISSNTATNSGGAIYAYRTEIAIEVGVDENSEETATVFDGNESQKFGGAIYVVSASTEIEGATFTGNAAETGGAIYAGGDVTLTDATFTTNSASNWGGALYMKDGVAEFEGVEFSENTADANGGALYLHAATATLTDATFSENTAATYGGAIEQVDGSLTISSSTFSKNASQNAGGAIYQLHGTTTISGVSFTENAATTKAGALYVGAGESTISDSTFSDNDSARGAAIYAHAATSLEIDGEAFPGTGAIEEEDLSTAILDEAFAELFFEELD